MRADGARAKGRAGAAHRAGVKADYDAAGLAALNHALLLSFHQYYSVTLDKKKIYQVWYMAQKSLCQMARAVTMARRKYLTMFIVGLRVAAVEPVVFVANVDFL